MPKNNISRKFHLQNIQEWLALAGQPIRKAQAGTANALKEHWSDADADAMQAMTDVANAVNTGLVWVMHSQDMIRGLLKEIETPTEDTKRPTDGMGLAYYCDACGQRFVECTTVVVGDVCSVCGKGTVLAASSEPEGEAGVYLRCTGCGALQSRSSRFFPGASCPMCESGKLADDAPEPERDAGYYLECMGCGIFQPVTGGFSSGDECPVCKDGLLEEPLPF